MKFNFMEKLLSRMFHKLAQATADHPWKFILVPLIISLGLTTGLLKIDIINQIEYLFPPHNTRGIGDRQIIEKLFPMNYSHDFEEGRIIKYQGMGKIIITPKDGGTVLRKEIFQDIEMLDTIVRRLSITLNNETFKYQDLCARNLNRRCYRNSLLSIKNKVESIRMGTFKLKFPLNLNNQTWDFEFYGNCLGGVELDDKGYLSSARAAALFYFLDASSPQFKEAIPLWENTFKDILLNMEMENIRIDLFTSKTMEDEFGNDTLNSMHFFIITVFIMLTFSVFTCMMTDWVRSKPMIGILGCISSNLSVGASMGLCIYCGMEFITINFIIPFIMLGIGLDDTFVVLSAWRRTDPTHSVKRRLSEAHSHAGVSITITSLTNLTSFLVGSMTPFKAANILCSYMSVAVLATYVYQVTFFAGFLALMARYEHENRHCLFFFRVLPKSQAKHKSLFYQKFLAGGISTDDPKNPEDNPDHAVMVFFRDKLGVWLCDTRVKIAVIGAFMVYLAGAFYGATNFKEGLEMHQIFSDNSYAYRFAKKEQQYFYTYLFRIQIAVHETLDYSSPRVQESIEGLISEMEALPFVGDKELTESWLRYFKIFVKDKRVQPWVRRYNLTDKQDFIHCLRNVFFKYPPARRFIKDIVFNEDYTEIIASRFLLQAVNVTDTVAGKTFLITVWNILEKQPFKALLYHPLFLILTMFVTVMDFTLMAVGVTSVIMMAITFVFIPSAAVSSCVAFSIMSIEVGVLGYMTFWDVNLNPTSLVCLIICIGFSVDNSAHIAFAFISSRGDGNAKMRNALYSVGLPISQACGSTLIGVMVLPFTPSYNFHTFFKTISLVMIFALCHSLLLFPILLSIFDKFFHADEKKSSEVEEKEQMLKLKPNMQIITHQTVEKDSQCAPQVKK